MHLAVELWERIEHVRISMGWSGREFARRAGLQHESHYSVLVKQLKSGQDIAQTTAAALANAAREEGFSTDWFLLGVGNERVTAPSAGKRSLSPTPMPSSNVRVGGTSCALPEPPPNRQRALRLLMDRGFDPDTAEEKLALAALDGKLSPCEDRPVAWWLDAVRDDLIDRSSE